MIKLKINGQEQTWDGDPDLPLLWFLRDEAGLTGTKFGCGVGLVRRVHRHHGQGGRARLHHLRLRRRRPRRSPPSKASTPPAITPVQKAWRQVNVPQCGFCQAGQIMQAAALLAENPKPSHDQIREAMAGNICRCGCYQRIENAVHLASTGV